MRPKFGWRPRLGWTGHRRAAAPNALGEDLRALPYGFTVLSCCTVRLPNHEERRAIELHKMEVDRQRALASTYLQRKLNL